MASPLLTARCSSMATGFRAFKPRPARFPRSAAQPPPQLPPPVSVVRTAPSRKILPSTETRSLGVEERAGVASILAERAANVGAIKSGSVALRLADEVG